MRKGVLFRRFADCAIAPTLRPIACSSRSGTRPALRAFARAAVAIHARAAPERVVRGGARPAAGTKGCRAQPRVTRRRPPATSPGAADQSMTESTGRARSDDGAATLHWVAPGLELRNLDRASR